MPVFLLKSNHIILDIDDNEKKYWKKKLEEDCEKFYWDWRYNINLSHVDNGFDMGSMLGKSIIIDVSKKANDKVRILYSGIGADEIMARNQYYSCGWANVNEFPEKLENTCRFSNTFFNFSITFDVIGRFKRSLSVTKRGLLIFKSKQASARSSILPAPNQILVG